TTARLPRCSSPPPPPTPDGGHHLTSSHRFSESIASGGVAPRCALVPLPSAAPSVGAARALMPRARWPAPRCLPRAGHTPLDTAAPRARRPRRSGGVCRPWPPSPPLLPPAPVSVLCHCLDPQTLVPAPLGRCDGRLRCVPEPAARCAGPNLDGLWCLSCRPLPIRNAEPQLTP